MSVATNMRTFWPKSFNRFAFGICSLIAAKAFSQKWFLDNCQRDVNMLNLWRQTHVCMCVCGNNIIARTRLVKCLKCSNDKQWKLTSSSWRTSSSSGDIDELRWLTVMSWIADWLAGALFMSTLAPALHQLPASVWLTLTLLCSGVKHFA